MLPPIVLVRDVSSWTLVSCVCTGGSVTGLYGWVEVCVRPSDVTVVVTAFGVNISSAKICQNLPVVVVVVVVMVVPGI